MAYGDLSMDAPLKPNKGLEGGACNRQSCQAEPALWYNHGSLAWYCGDCRQDIQFDSFNLRDWTANWYPKMQHPMFETRVQMDMRERATIYGSPTGRTQPDHAGIDHTVAIAASMSGYKPTLVSLDEFSDGLDMAAQPSRLHLEMIKALMAPIKRSRPTPTRLTGRVMLGYGVQLLPVSSTKKMTKRKLRRLRGKR